METITAAVTNEILNDLIGINNDRIAGYEKALRELPPTDADLKPVFSAMITESHQLRNALGNEVQANGGTMETGTTAAGKIYRAWSEVKALFSGHDRRTILANCEATEDAVLQAYQDSLDLETMPAYIRELLAQQKALLKQAHDKVKTLRDQARK